MPLVDYGASHLQRSGNVCPVAVFGYNFTLHGVIASEAKQSHFGAEIASTPEDASRNDG